MARALFGDRGRDARNRQCNDKRKFPFKASSLKVSYVDLASNAPSAVPIIAPTVRLPLYMALAAILAAASAVILALRQMNLSAENGSLRA